MQSAPRPSLRGGVIGQVTEVSEGSLQVNQTSKPVVTLRLERFDPHGGRTIVAIVRLSGGDALGFAGDGDWVEARGRQKSAYLVASRAINHTTGAVYGARTAGSVLRVLVVLVIFAVIAVVFVVVVRAFVSTSHNIIGGQQRQQLIQQCVAGGATLHFCESAVPK